MFWTEIDDYMYLLIKLCEMHEDEKPTPLECMCSALVGLVEIQPKRNLGG